jgi:hypothetical protein
MTAAECVKKMMSKYGKVPEVWKAKEITNG